jgi:hypothetical protein
LDNKIDHGLWIQAGGSIASEGYGGPPLFAPNFCAGYQFVFHRDVDLIFDFWIGRYYVFSNTSRIGFNAGGIGGVNIGIKL